MGCFVSLFVFLAEIHIRKDSTTSLRKKKRINNNITCRWERYKKQLRNRKKWCQGATRAACSLSDEELGLKVTLGQPAPPPMGTISQGLTILSRARSCDGIYQQTQAGQVMWCITARVCTAAEDGDRWGWRHGYKCAPEVHLGLLVSGLGKDWQTWGCAEMAS